MPPEEEEERGETPIPKGADRAYFRELGRMRRRVEKSIGQIYRTYDMKQVSDALKKQKKDKPVSIHPDGATGLKWRNWNREVLE